MFDFVPTSSTLSHLRSPDTSFLSREGGSFRLTTDHIDIAVVIEVPKGAASAAMCG